MIQDLAKRLLPLNMVKKLKTVYKENITEYKRDIYSEFGEDFIAAVLLGFKRDGVYVDIGAYRPKELSTTYYFYRKLMWSGLIIEPNPMAKGEFVKQRPRDVFINMGVAGEEGELTYYHFEDPTLNSFDSNVVERTQNRYLGKEIIHVEPLSKILDDNLSEDKAIDLMNIDVEGLDLEVLKSNNWAKYSPTVIIIEDHNFNPESPLDSEIFQFLKNRGYSLKANCLISLVFCKDSIS